MPNIITLPYYLIGWLPVTTNLPVCLRDRHNINKLYEIFDKSLCLSNYFDFDEWTWQCNQNSVFVSIMGCNAVLVKVEEKLEIFYLFLI